MAARLSLLFDALAAARKSGKAITAQTLAAQLGVSVRTLHRDLEHLRAAGIDVRGKTGVGFSLPSGAPATLDAVELEVPRRGAVEARVRATPAGLKLLAEDRELAVERRRGEERTVRARSREALLRAVLRAGGEVVLLSPDKLRREVRTRARAIARAHKR